MATQLRNLYELLKHFSTSTHQSMCEDCLRKLKASGPGLTLAEWFNDALAENASFSNEGQPFLNAQSRENRKPIGPDSKGGERIVYLLSSKEVEVAGLPYPYRFCCTNRELPPLRQEGAGDPTSGAGGIDYTARTTTNPVRPVLGEIKVGNDENPFYALIQLLTYLSEMASANQIARAVNHKELGDLPLEFPQPFDLHILLADFNDRGDKGPLIDLTYSLVSSFKSRLADRYKEAAKVVGSVLCLRMNTAAFATNQASMLECIWTVYQP
jgi:hypothetical protein